MRPAKVRKVRITSHLKKESVRRLYEMAEAAECSRSDIIDDLLARPAMLEEIRKILREELGK